MLAHNCHRANKEQRQRSCARPNQSRHGPPGRSNAAARTLCFVRHTFAKLVTKKVLIAQGLGSKFLLQKQAEVLRVALLGFGRRQIRQRRFEFNQFSATQLAIEPGSPFFFKRFHTRLSGYFAISCGHKTGATSPCRWSNQGSRQSRDIASLQFLSSKLPGG